MNGIREVMEEMGNLYLIIVVDDGSRDETQLIVQEKAKTGPIIYLKHEHNQGLGAALRDGFHWAAREAQAQDIIITMDADDTHPPEAMAQMVGMIQGGYDVVIASRYVPGTRIIGVPIYRQLLSLGASLLMRMVIPMKGIKDYTCGYRAYRADIIKRAMANYEDQFITEDGFQVMVDILIKLKNINAQMVEVPFILRYDQKVEKSKMNVFRTVKDTLLLLIKRCAKKEIRC